MTNAVTTSTHLTERSGWYGALASLFRYPDEESFPLLTDALANLRPIERQDDTGHPGRVREALDTAGLTGFRLEHSRLFSAAVECRPNETDYQRLSFNMTQQMADVSGFYEAFGFIVDPSSGERPDYIGTELEFTRLLLLKEAVAIENGLDEQADLTGRAVNDFLQDHITNWVPEFCDRLTRATGGEGVFGAVATLLRAFVESERDEMGGAR